VSHDAVGVGGRTWDTSHRNTPFTEVTALEKTNSSFRTCRQAASTEWWFATSLSVPYERDAGHGLVAGRHYSSLINGITSEPRQRCHLRKPCRPRHEPLTSTRDLVGPMSIRTLRGFVPPADLGGESLRIPGTIPAQPPISPRRGARRDAAAPSPHWPGVPHPTRRSTCRPGLDPRMRQEDPTSTTTWMADRSSTSATEAADPMPRQLRDGQPVRPTN
jgi:hypothetical protein